MTMRIDPLLRALADPTRLRIMRLLSAMELAVGELAQVLGQSQPRVSRHVRILCDAGLAETVSFPHVPASLRLGISALLAKPFAVSRLPGSLRRASPENQGASCDQEHPPLHQPPRCRGPHPPPSFSASAFEFKPPAGCKNPILRDVFQRSAHQRAALCDMWQGTSRQCWTICRVWHGIQRQFWTVCRVWQGIQRRREAI